MDESLFQLVTVGLLGVTLLVLLVTLLTLNKLAKKVEEGSTARAEAPYQEDRAGGPPGRVALAPEDHETGAPSPAETSTFPATAVAAQEHAAHQQEEQADIAARAEEPQVARVGDEPAPAEGPQPSAAAEVAQPESQPVQAATGFEDAPEEQPFERDGRWWFKRGDELLVYDEQSGQWESAPADTAVSSPASPLIPRAAGSGHSPTTQAAGVQAEPDQSAQDPESFWKCASCGAVNGSTATSCRMCFAPKP